MKQQKPYEEGSVLMDAPQHNDMDELAELAQDTQSWRVTKHAIGSSKQCSTFDPPPVTRAPHAKTRVAPA